MGLSWIRLVQPPSPPTMAAFSASSAARSSSSLRRIAPTSADAWRRVRLVTWTIPAVNDWCLRLGHGPYRLSTTGVFDRTPYEGCSLPGVSDW
jgi:hypothetical protein